MTDARHNISSHRPPFARGRDDIPMTLGGTNAYPREHELASWSIGKQQLRSLCMNHLGVDVRDLSRKCREAMFRTLSWHQPRGQALDTKQDRDLRAEVHAVCLYHTPTPTH